MAQAPRATGMSPKLASANLIFMWYINVKTLKIKSELTKMATTCGFHI